MELQYDKNKNTGLTHKYNVERVDGKPINWCFVLEDKDPLAISALWTYAHAAHHAGYKSLSSDLFEKLGTELDPRGEESGPREEARLNREVAGLRDLLCRMNGFLITDAGHEIHMTKKFAAFVWFPAEHLGEDDAQLVIEHDDRETAFYAAKSYSDAALIEITDADGVTSEQWLLHESGVWQLCGGSNESN